MQVQLRGSLRATLGTGSVELDVPPEGCPLSTMLSRFAAGDPRARHALQRAGHGEVLRVVHNGVVVEAGEDPRIAPEDSVLLLVAMQGG